ncbi:rod shape-determining protein MreC [Aquimonas sp.]|uniref:rod shape-determining protein MreC n=1 Tax=Aquimonas sp. TaxID=1872588 RepID=UPI0037BEFAF5
MFSEAGAGPLRLLVYLLVAVALMVADHRTAMVERIRAVGSALAQPLYLLAGLPAQLAVQTRDAFTSHSDLLDERHALSQQLLVAQARLDRLYAVQQENQRLRDLLGGTRGLLLSVQLASVLNVDLDPFRHRILIDAGERRGARPGLALIDSRGVVGQILDVSPWSSTALLISDPSHSVLVQVVRTGLRTIAYGTGRTDELLLPNIPQSADIAVGDVLVTSGIGGRFPAGLAVGEVTSIAADDTRLFLVASARPAAQLDRSGELLLLWTTEATPEVGPPLELSSPAQAGGVR